MHKFIFHADPGHGWLAVKRSLIERLDLLTQISTCSYQRGGTVYLEEDCDANRLLHALKERGEEYTIETRHTNERSPIRSYPHFSAKHAPFEPEPQMFVEYNDEKYRIEYRYKRGRWAVTRLRDGLLMAMRPWQLQRAQRCA